MVVLAYQTVRMCARGVKIPEGNVLKAMGDLTVLQDFLEDEFCLPIGIYWDRRIIFLNRNPGRISVHGGRGGKYYLFHPMIEHFT